MFAGSDVWLKTLNDVCLDSQQTEFSVANKT